MKPIRRISSPCLAALSPISATPDSPEGVLRHSGELSQEEWDPVLQLRFRGAWRWPAGDLLSCSSNDLFAVTAEKFVQHRGPLSKEDLEKSGWPRVDKEEVVEGFQVKSTVRQN